MINQEDEFRKVMRRWPSGVSVVTSRMGEIIHGMTVNSFTSVSIHPPMVTVTLANITRTYGVIKQSSIFGVTILSEKQMELSNRFAGKIREDADRFEGLELFSLETGAPFIKGGLGYLDCRVVHTYVMLESTLLVGEVVAALPMEFKPPLVYLNRLYRKLNNEF